MKAKVDHETCIGCGACAEVCSAVFEMKDDGLSHVIIDPITDEHKDCMLEAESICPVEAISHED